MRFRQKNALRILSVRKSGSSYYLYGYLYHCLLWGLQSIGKEQHWKINAKDEVAWLKRHKGCKPYWSIINKLSSLIFIQFWIINQAHIRLRWISAFFPPLQLFASDVPWVPTIRTFWLFCLCSDRSRKGIGWRWRLRGLDFPWAGCSNRVEGHRTQESIFIQSVVCN